MNFEREDFNPLLTSYWRGSVIFQNKWRTKWMVPPASGSFVLPPEVWWRRTWGCAGWTRRRTAASWETSVTRLIASRSSRSGGNDGRKTTGPSLVNILYTAEYTADCTSIIKITSVSLKFKYLTLGILTGTTRRTRLTRRKSLMNFLTTKIRLGNLTV